MSKSSVRKRIVSCKNVLKRAGVCLLSAVLLAAAPGTAQAGTKLSKREKQLIFYGRVKANDNSKPSCMESEGWNHIKKFDLAPYGLDGSLSYFHGMYYLVSLKKTRNCKALDGGKNAVLKKGTKMIVMRAVSRQSGKNCICRAKVGKAYRTFGIRTKFLKFHKYIFNSSKPYTNAQVENWVNRHRIKSDTDYLVFVSKYNQYLWIMKRVNNKWVVQDRTKSSTGGVFNKGYPNDIYNMNHCKLYKWHKSVPGMNLRCITYTETEGNTIHGKPKDKLGHPHSMGCVGVPWSWVMKTSKGKTQYVKVFALPKNTRLVLF